MDTGDDQLLGFLSGLIIHDLKQQQLADLFEYAQQSKEAYAMVQDMPKVEAEMHVNISSPSWVVIYFGDWGSLSWHFHQKRNPQRFVMEDKDKEQIVVKMDTPGGSTELVFAKTQANSYGYGSNAVEYIVPFIQHINTLFNPYVAYLKISPSNFHQLSAIQSVDALRKSLHVTIEEGPASHEDMRRILEGFETDSLEIHCSPGSKFTYDSPISLSYMKTQIGTWFKGPMLLNLVNCEDAYLDIGGITEEHVNRFLREWLNSTTGCGTMKSLLLNSGLQHCELDERSWCMEKMVQGLTSFELPSPTNSSLDMRRLCRKIDGAVIDVHCYDYLGFCMTQEML